MFQNLRQLELRGPVESGDFVNKERPPISLFKGGGQFWIATEEALVNFLIFQEGATDLDKGPLAAVASGMDRPRGQLLTGPGLALQQDRPRLIGRATDQVIHLPEALRTKTAAQLQDRQATLETEYRWRSLKSFLRDKEQEYVRELLRRTQGDQAKAAGMLGLSLTDFRQKYGVLLT